MTIEEMKKAISELKAEGHEEEEILGAFYKMFQDDKLTIDELDGIVNLMGYHLTDEFKAMSPEDQKTKGYEEVEDTEEESGKELTDDGKEASGNDDDTEEDKLEEDDDEEDESEEEARAMKLFGQK